jgi:hypothetical protein
MARGHGRILTSIWEDTDFLGLTPAQQRMYLFLISQPNLNHAGLLPLTLKRWSRKALGLSVAEVDATLAQLAERRFVVIDDDTEELLIRTFVRNDGVWRQPKVMAAMVSGAQEISSHLLRRALLAEMDKLPLDDLSGEPGPRGPSVRDQVREHLATLRRTIAVGDPKGSERVTDTPPEAFGNPSGTLPDTPDEPFPETSRTPGEGTTRAHAPAHDARSPAPAPAPAPEQTSPRSGSDQQDAIAGAAQPPDPKIQRPDVEEACAALADAIEANGSRRPTITAAWRTEARLLMDKDGRTLDQVLAAIAWCQNDPFWRSNVLSMPKLRERYDQMRLKAQSQQVAHVGAPSQQPGEDLFDRAMQRANARTQQQEEQ